VSQGAAHPAAGHESEHSILQMNELLDDNSPPGEGEWGINTITRTGKIDLDPNSPG